MSLTVHHQSTTYEVVKTFLFQSAFGKAFTCDQHILQLVSQVTLAQC